MQTLESGYASRPHAGHSSAKMIELYTFSLGAWKPILLDGTTSPVKRESITPKMRDVMFAEQSGECNYCKKAITQSPADFDCDHIVPVKHGGPTCRANLHLLCVSCHRRKCALEMRKGTSTHASESVLVRTDPCFPTVKPTDFPGLKPGIYSLNYEEHKPPRPSLSTTDLSRASGTLRARKRRSLLAEISTDSDVYEDDIKGLLRWRGDEVTNQDIIANVQSFIRTQMGVVGDQNHYANVRVKTVYVVTGKPRACWNDTDPKAHWKKMRVRVQGEGSRFCMNRGRHHESNSIYFEMERDVCHQRCFCEDDVVGATSMTCKDFTAHERGGRGLSRVRFELFNPNPYAWLSRPSPAMPVIQLEEKRATNN